MCHSPILAITKLKLKINPKGRSLPETRSSQSCYSSEMESWDFSADLLSQQSLCKQRIKENVDKVKLNKQLPLLEFAPRATARLFLAVPRSYNGGVFHSARADVSVHLRVSWLACQSVQYR